FAHVGGGALGTDLGGVLSFVFRDRRLQRLLGGDALTGRRRAASRRQPPGPTRSLDRAEQRLERRTFRVVLVGVGGVDRGRLGDRALAGVFGLIARRGRLDRRQRGGALWRCGSAGRRRAGGRTG